MRAFRYYDFLVAGMVAVLFALAYGGNGITYSMLGAGLLRAQIERRPHPLTALFSFARLR